MSNDLIWYVCYGSNLCYERFMCYITGNGNSKYGVKANPSRQCSNTKKPQDIKVVTIPYELYFANKSTSWDNKGTCFIDFNKKAFTIGRAYLITKEQYEHVKKYEGSNYNHEVPLDSINGIEAKTFTSPKRLIPNIDPCERYFNVVRDGLMECGLSAIEAEVYLKERIK